MNVFEEIKKQYAKAGPKGVVTSGSEFLIRKVLPNSLTERLVRKPTNQYITRSELQSSNTIIKLTYYGSDEVIEIKPPIYNGELPEYYKRNLGTLKISQPFVCLIDTKGLFGTRCFGVNQKNEIILETTRARGDYLKRYLSLHPFDTLAYHIYDFLPERSITGRPVVSLAQDRDYHHWLFNSLSRLQGLEKFSENFDDDYIILIPANPPSWIIESLKLYGFDEKDLIEWKWRYAASKRMIVPTIRRKENTKTDTFGGEKFDISRKVISPDVSNWLRQKAIENISKLNPGEFSSRIIISREDAQTRMIENKERVYADLYEEGFKEYTLSTLTFRDQVRLFNQAEFIVSPTGAGLSNMVFSDSAKILTIHGESSIKPTYFLLASVLNLDYGFVIGEQDHINDNIQLNKDDLMECYYSLKTSSSIR